MIFEIMKEETNPILTDAVDEELDAIDDLIVGGEELRVEDCLIPDELVDAETDDTDFEKYIED